MSVKASLHGPNRRRNRPGDLSVASNLRTNTAALVQAKAASFRNDEDPRAGVRFRIRSLDRLLETHPQLVRGLGDACLFDAYGPAGRLLMRRHRVITGRLRDPRKEPSRKVAAEIKAEEESSRKNDPLLVHFHDVPVFVMRCVPLPEKIRGEGDVDAMFLSKVHCHNHKVCEDTWMSVTCCSRPPALPSVLALPAPAPSKRKRDFDVLSVVQLEAHRRIQAGVRVCGGAGTLRQRRDDDDGDGNGDGDGDGDGSNEEEEEEEGDADNDDDDADADGPEKEAVSKLSFRAKDIARAVMNHVPRSVLTVNESLVVNVDGTDLVCRVAEVRIRDSNSESDSSIASGGAGSNVAAALMDDPYRGRVSDFTEFYVAASDPAALDIDGSRRVPEGKLPEDVVHVTTSDMEWFPVRRILLAPCIKLTKYVQAGRGKYNEIPTLPDNERSEDAPTDDGCPHCRVPIDCCTFDRVLVFITSLLYPNESTPFALDLSEINALSDAADALGLQPLSDLCASQRSSFQSRVRRDRYIRLSEVEERNGSGGELLIVLDGMVLDITRWIDEHPGGPSIIPTQALNIECSGFFEMYHVSRQAFLYLKSFYIGELSPEDRAKLSGTEGGAEASEAFLRSLRGHTDDWRVRDVIAEHPEEKVHKSL